MIYYKLETELKGCALQKMEESIPPLIQKITEIIELCNSEEEITEKLEEEIPFRMINWKTSFSNLPEYQIEFDASKYCTIIINIKDVIREFKIRKILNE